MITEDYVSFEVAKLLKEKGFHETSNTIGTYNNKGEFYLYWHEKGYDHNRLSTWYSAPTLQMAMKWLRKKYDLHCDTDYDDLDWCWDILSISEMVPVAERPKVIKNGNAGYKSYEEACEAAIQYSLKNLI